MSLGIAFEGCACRAAFHVGVVERLQELGIQFQVTAGASAGSLAAAAVALDRMHDMRRCWEGLLGLRWFQPRRLLRGGSPLPLSETLDGILVAELGDLPMSAVPRPLAIVVTQLRLRGRYRRVITHTEEVSIRRVVLASSFFPGPYTRMVPFERRLTVDGAWEVRTPVHEAHALGATRVVACVSNAEGALLRGFFGWQRDPVPPWCRVLAPVEPLALGSWDFDPARTRAAMAEGRRSAEAFVQANTAWLEGAADARGTPRG